MVVELISKVFATRDAVHLQHWATTSYAEHMALGTLSSELIDHIDAIIEAHQGLFGRVGKVDLAPIEADDLLAHLQDEADWIESVRSELAGGSTTLENLIDGLAGAYIKTIYLLSMK